MTLRLTTQRKGLKTMDQEIIFNSKETGTMNRHLILLTVAVMLVVASQASRADDDKLRDLGPLSAQGEIPKWDGSQWRPAHDDTTTVVAGPGLTGGGSNRTVTVSVAFAGPGSSNTVARADYVQNTMPPVGAVIAWLKSLPNTPANLPSGWVECNGQTVDDAASPYNGQAVPDLNASGGGQKKRFLRGSTTSGTTGGSEEHDHGTVGLDGQGVVQASAPGGANHLPPYYEVVWIMRVK